jgi:hypothetical protein
LQAKKFRKEKEMKKTAKTGRAGMRKFWTTPAVLLVAGVLASCIAAIPLILTSTSHKKTQSQAEMPLPAEKVHTAAVDMAREKNLKISKEEENNYLEVTDGVQTVAYVTEPDGPEKCKLTVSAEISPAKDEKREQTTQREKDLTLQKIDDLCERLNVKPVSIKQ